MADVDTRLAGILADNAKRNAEARALAPGPPPPLPRDLTGTQIGPLHVLGRSGTAPHGHVIWLALCEGCGEDVLAYSHDLRAGRLVHGCAVT